MLQPVFGADSLLCVRPPFFEVLLLFAHYRTGWHVLALALHKCRALFS